MLWEHLQNKDFYLFSGAPTSAKLLPLALVQKELSMSWRSFQTEPVQWESGVILEGPQGAEKNCCSNCWAATWRRQRCHVLASTRFLFQLQLKLRLFLRKGRWLVECYHTLNQLERTELGAFQDGYNGIAFSDLKTQQNWMETDRRTDGWMDGLMNVDFERRSWQQPIRPDEHESSSRGKTALCRVPPLTCLPAKRKRTRWTRHKTHKFTCSRLFVFFCLTTLLTFFFPC